ncbi:MAG: 3-keto-5-aminohexanoate cleavage protein [Fibrobacteria bacterium]|nr:3-keto-5-aminohexanoate cleavage protein [Fibrobacteria bacterium]
MREIVITCAITGAETTRAHNPALPLTPREIAGSAAAACRAGASIIHLHVRKQDGTPTQDKAIFKDAIKRIRDHCDAVIEVTTGGAVGMSLEERLQPLELSPEMASLDCGSTNFGDEYIVNTIPMMRKAAQTMARLQVRPTLECFDISHIDGARLLINEGLLKPPFHYGLVMNVPGGVFFSKETLDFFYKRLPQKSFWTGIGIGGRAAKEAISASVLSGGFVRVGFEDNVWEAKGKLAESNASLVEQAVEIIKHHGHRVASPKQVRTLFNLKGV